MTGVQTCALPISAEKRAAGYDCAVAGEAMNMKDAVRNCYVIGFKRCMFFAINIDLL